jgi:hypothetical protein
MKGQKPFDPNESKKYDRPAKIVATKILEKKGFEVFPHEKAQQYLYDHFHCEPNTISDNDLIHTDVICYNLERKVICVELEVRLFSRDGESFFELLKSGRYKTAHVPLRKIENNNVSDFYIFFNYQLSEYGVIKYSDILLFPEIEVRCRNKGDYDYDYFKNIDNTKQYINYYKVHTSCLPQNNGLVFNGDEMYWSSY